MQRRFIIIHSLRHSACYLSQLHVTVRNLSSIFIRDEGKTSDKNSNNQTKIHVSNTSRNNKFGVDMQSLPSIKEKLIQYAPTLRVSDTFTQDDLLLAIQKGGKPSAAKIPIVNDEGVVKPIVIYNVFCGASRHETIAQKSQRIQKLKENQPKRSALFKDRAAETLTLLSRRAGLTLHPLQQGNTLFNFFNEPHTSGVHTTVSFGRLNTSFIYSESDQAHCTAAVGDIKRCLEGGGCFIFLVYVNDIPKVIFFLSPQDLPQFEVALEKNQIASSSHLSYYMQMSGRRTRKGSLAEVMGVYQLPFDEFLLNGTLHRYMLSETTPRRQLKDLNSNLAFPLKKLQNSLAPFFRLLSNAEIEDGKLGSFTVPVEDGKYCTVKGCYASRVGSGSYAIHLRPQAGTMIDYSVVSSIMAVVPIHATGVDLSNHFKEFSDNDDIVTSSTDDTIQVSTPATDHCYILFATRTRDGEIAISPDQLTRRMMVFQWNPKCANVIETNHYHPAQIEKDMDIVPLTFPNQDQRIKNGEKTKTSDFNEKMLRAAVEKVRAVLQDHASRPALTAEIVQKCKVVELAAMAQEEVERRKRRRMRRVFDETQSSK